MQLLPHIRRVSEEIRKHVGGLEKEIDSEMRDRDCNRTGLVGNNPMDNKGNYAPKKDYQH